MGHGLCQVSSRYWVSTSDEWWPGSFTGCCVQRSRRVAFTCSVPVHVPCDPFHNGAVFFAPLIVVTVSSCVFIAPRFVPNLSIAKKKTNKQCNAIETPKLKKNLLDVTYGVM